MSKIGRPREYDPAICEIVLEELSKGKSQRAVSGVIGIVPDTWYRWIREYPDFSYAVRLGCSRGLNTYEEGMIEAMNGKKPKFKENIAMFMLSRRFSDIYGEKTEQKQEITVESFQIVEYEEDSPVQETEAVLPSEG